MSDVVHAKTCLLLAPATALLISAASFAQSQCTPLAVYRPDQVAKGKSASVRVLQGVPMTNYREESDAEIENLLRRKAVEALASSHYFSSVVAPSPGSAANADLNFELSFSSVSPGLREVPFVPTAPTVIIFRGSVRTRDADPVVDFLCVSQSHTGLFGRPKKWVHRGIERAAAKLKEMMPKLERDLARDSSSARGPIVSMPSEVDKWWMLSPPPDWHKPRKDNHWWLPRSPSDDGMRIGTLSPVAPSGTVFAVLVSAADSDFFKEDFQWMARFAADLIGGPPGESFAREVESELDKESYLLLVWLAKRGAPRWDVASAARKTFLITSRRSDDAISPVRFAGSSPYVPLHAARDGWTYNIAMFVFPTTRIDGTPVLTSPSEQVELRTEVDGRAAILRFDASRSGIDSTDRLIRRR